MSPGAALESALACLMLLLTLCDCTNVHGAVDPGYAAVLSSTQ